jgi:hypothetical protein
VTDLGNGHVTVRPAGPADLPAVAALIDATLAEAESLGVERVTVHSSSRPYRRTSAGVRELGAVASGAGFDGADDVVSSLADGPVSMSPLSESFRRPSGLPDDRFRPPSSRNASPLTRPVERDEAESAAPAARSRQVASRGGVRSVR